jgi:hypothetical protein
MVAIGRVNAEPTLLEVWLEFLALRHALADTWIGSSREGSRHQDAHIIERKDPCMRGKLARKVATGVAAAAGVVALAGGAPAFGAATVTPNSGLTNGSVVTINWSGFNPNEIVFINECWKAQDDPTFDPFASCSPVNSLNPSSAPDGSGTTQFTIWAGLDPNVGEDSCGFHDPNELAFHDTCYIRLAPGAQAGTARDETYAITFQTTQVPEAPYTVLLPLGAVAVLGGAYFVVRNRSRKPAAA